jgi:phage-related protein
LRELESVGFLAEPEAKKLDRNLYEMRVRVQEAWRGFYAYIEKDEVIALHFFQKKTQHTPVQSLKLAKQRLQQYL